MLRMLLLVYGGLTLAAQTQMDLRTQAKNIDFSAANSTRPIKTGTALPATCVVGNMFFKTDAQTGENLYGCTAANTWSVQGGIPIGNCQYNAVSQILTCTDSNNNVYATVETAAGGAPNQWIDYIAPTGVPHTSRPTPAAVGAVADPGSNGIPFRNGLGTAAPANAGQMSGPFSCQDAGAGGSYACSLSPAISSYQTGASYWFKAGGANAGAATVNFNALGAKSLVKQYNQALSANDIRAGQWVIVTYDGTNMQMQSQTANALQGAVASLFGRTGAVTAQSGDYNSGQVTESGNLYFSNTRVWGALAASAPVSFNASTGTVGCASCVTSSTAADTDLYGTFPHLSVVRLQGQPVSSTPPANLQYLGWNSGANQWQPTTLPGAAMTSLFGRTGAVTAQSGDYNTGQIAESGNMYFTNARVWSALAGSAPISFNASTGALGCASCVTSSTAADTDLSGTFPHLSVVRLQGLPVAGTPPANLQYLGWNGSANQWQPTALPAAPVTSLFGRAGAVAAQSGDYSFAQISGTAGASQLPAVAMLTNQGNAVTAGTQDFSNAAHTLPMKSGTIAALPALCAAGETYFATNAPAGGNLYGCAAANVWTAQGNLSVKSGAVTVGARGAANFTVGAGLMSTISDDGAEINIQSALDTAVVQTQPGEQSGSALLCASGSASATQYACALNPTLAAYTSGMTLHWKPDVAGAGGPTTLNIDTLGARQLKESDGATDPASTDISAGKLYNIWFDGSVFRFVAVAGGTSGGGAVASVFGRTGSVAAQSGDYTTSLVAEGANLYFTNARTWAALSAGSPITLNGSTGAIGCAACLTTATTADTDLSGTFPHLSVVKVNGAAIPASGMLKANAGGQLVQAAAGDVPDLSATYSTKSGANTMTGYSDFSGGRWRLPEATFAVAPDSPQAGQAWLFTDAAAAGTCAGGGSAMAQCRWTGAAWGSIGGASPAYPGAGIPNSTGSAWGASYTPGTAANNLVQLNASAQLPAVSAALLTNFPAALMTTSTAATAAQMPALTGDATSAAGSVATTVAKVNGTSVPVNSSADQVLGVTAGATGAWLSVPNCGSGNALQYATATHAFSCGAAGGSTRTWPFQFRGVSQSGVAAFSANLPASGAPAPANAGGVDPAPVLEWPIGQSAYYAWWTFELPAGYVSNANIAYAIASRCNPAACDSTHAAVLTPYWACVSGGALDALAWTPVSSLNITNAAAAARTVTTGTIAPTCAAGNQASVKFLVNTSANSMTGPFDLVSVTFGVQGAM